MHTLTTDVGETIAALPGDVVDHLSGRSILITGTTGQIGGYLLLVLSELAGQVPGLRVTAAGRSQTALLTTLSRWWPEKQWRDLRFLSYDAATPITADVDADLIVHAASPTNPEDFRERPVDTITANSEGTRLLLDYLRARGSGCLLLLSTREVYGAATAGSQEVTENEFGPLDPMHPRSAYPESKRLAEAYCTAYRGQYDVESKVARIAHTYGPTMRLSDGRVLSDLIGTGVTGGEIRLRSDGSGRLVPTYIADLATGLLLVATKGEQEVYNVGRDNEDVSVADLARAVVDAPSSRATSFHVQSTATTPAGYLNYQPAYLSAQRLRDLGWQPTVSLASGLERTLAALRAMHEA